MEEQTSIFPKYFRGNHFVLSLPIEKGKGQRAKGKGDRGEGKGGNGKGEREKGKEKRGKGKGERGKGETGKGKVPFESLSILQIRTTYFRL